MAKRRSIATDARTTVFSRERVLSVIRSRYNALTSLTPEQLKMQHSAWDGGYLRQFALTQEQIVDRDDMLKGVEGKRVKAASVRGYDILTSEETPPAELHRQCLEDFYNNVTVTNAIDENERGGVGMLFRGQMKAVGFKYAVHEVVWKPSASHISAELRFAPLYFFENVTGRLRFLPSDVATFGADLEPSRWIVTVGEHLMKACSIAYIYKHLPLRDWLIYCGRHGMPGIAGKTTAAPDSAEWKAMETAVANFAAEFAAVMSSGDSIEPLNMSAQGELPYPKIIDRMDRMMAALWRGADLSTISSGADSVGSSLQAEEKEVLEASDSAMISEALNTYLDPWVIRYHLGDETPLAYIQVKTATRRIVEQDLKVDQQLHTMGFPIQLKTLSATYNRPLPEGSPEILAPPQAPPQGPGQRAPIPAAANERRPALVEPGPIGEFLASIRLALPAAISADLKPLADRLIELYRAADAADMDDEPFRALLKTFRDEELPELAKKILSEAQAPETLREIMNAAFALGIEQGAEVTA